MSNTGLMDQIRNPPEPSIPALVICKLLFCAIPIAQIAIGAIYLEDCPRNHYIPIYLIVVGVFGVILSVVSCLPGTRQGKDDPSTPLTQVCKVWHSLTSVFLFCWFITGNVWIYSIYKPDFNKNATNIDQYCDKTLYLFAFWITTLVYIVLGLSLFCGCCVLLCRFMFGCQDPDDI
ncbi:unnamed protein product [Ophioblennius macclurei]